MKQAQRPKQKQKQNRSVTRCPWPGEDLLMQEYHDREWGVPVHDDKKHFEFLVLDTAQAGLSWKTILHKREGYRRAFRQFNVRAVARMDGNDVRRLMKDPGIVRNRLKIKATISNAKRFLEVQREFGSFDTYVWGFVDAKRKPIVPRRLADIRATSPESDALSKDLKRRGFSFVGSTICYAYMQAAGLVNDHLSTCFCRRGK